MNSDASIDSLLKLEEDLGASHALVCSSALSPKQVESINNFLHDELVKHPNLVGFASMHRDMEGFKEEIKRIKDMGFKGIKFHHARPG